MTSRPRPDGLVHHELALRPAPELQFQARFGQELRARFDDSRDRCSASVKPQLLMRNLRIPFVTLLLAVPAVLALAQRVETFERSFRPHVARGYIGPAPGLSTPQPRSFYINRVAYSAWMAGESIKSSPDWTPSKPMPIAFEQLAQAARQELAKLVDDDSSWAVTSFQLHSIPEEQVLKWYCVIEMKPFWEPGPAGPEDSHDSFCVYIDLSGRPGVITRQYAGRQK